MQESNSHTERELTPDAKVAFEKAVEKDVVRINYFNALSNNGRVAIDFDQYTESRQWQECDEAIAKFAELAGIDVNNASQKVSVERKRRGL